jgi:outer membrane protein
MRAIALCLGLSLVLSLGVAAQTYTNSARVTRSMTLQEAVQSALKRNIGLRIAKMDLDIASTRLFGAYGYYDTRFDLNASYSLNTEEETLDFTTGTIILPGERTRHLLSPGFVGALPWGLKYDIGADLSYLRHTGSSRGTNNSIANFDLDNYNLDVGISLTQPLLRNFWIDQGRMTIQFDRSTLKMSEFALRDAINKLVRDVMLNYYELIFTVENVRVNEKALELADRLAAENKKKVEVGTMAPLEEKQAQAQAATARAALISALQQAGTQQRTLINLLTDNYEEWQNSRLVPAEALVAVPQSYNLPASWIEALTHRPDFNQKKEEVERQGIEVKYRFNQLLPQLDLVGTYGRLGVDKRIGGTMDDIRADRLPRYSFGAIFSIPLENRSARGSYRESKLNRDRLQEELKQLHQQILFDVEIAVGSAQADFERVAATREAATAAEAAYDAEVKKLENGKSTSFQVLSLQNDLTGARSRHIRALADYNRALTQIYYNEGTILDRARMDLKP